jgi:hypothetical protein
MATKYKIEFFGGPLNKEVEVRSGEIPDLIVRSNHLYRKSKEIVLADDEMFILYIYDEISSFNLHVSDKKSK